MTKSKQTETCYTDYNLINLFIYDRIKNKNDYEHWKNDYELKGVWTKAKRMSSRKKAMNIEKTTMKAKNYSNGFCWSSAPTENFIFLQSRERFLMRRILLFLVSYQFNQSAQDALQARCWKLTRYYKWDVATSQGATREMVQPYGVLQTMCYNLKRHLRPYTTLFQSSTCKNQETTWGLRPVTCSRGTT